LISNCAKTQAPEGQNEISLKGTVTPNRAGKRVVDREPSFLETRRRRALDEVSPSCGVGPQPDNRRTVTPPSNTRGRRKMAPLFI